jgi:tRNA (mo5U34)-methyltransferase
VQHLSLNGECALPQIPTEAPPQAALEQRIRELGPWFHNMPVGGILTEPNHFLGDYPAVKWRHISEAIPADLTGKSVLDIGCNAGFYSQQMKLRNAARVLGIDTDEHYLAQARFAAEVNGLDIEFTRMSIWEIASLRETFDLVLFMGVFYHLRHPLLALDLIHAHVSRDLLVFQSLERGSRAVVDVDPDYGFNEPAPFDLPGYPKMHFVEHSYSHDPTNWWIPNRACVEAMLRSSGFRIDSQPEDETYLCRWQPIQIPPDGPHAVYPISR